MIDLNQHNYKGNFAKVLAEKDIQMDEVFYQMNDIQVPKSHSSGSDPICGIYVSLGSISLNTLSIAVNLDLVTTEYIV